MTKKVIIIDDSATQLNILKAIFADSGWEVCGIQSARIGYEMIFDFAPDLIITDAIMPLMGGFKLIKMIRDDDKISKIPVIVYSVLDEINAKFYIKEELSEYFLKKDNNYKELLELADKLVERFPLEKEYKDNILRVGLDIYKNKHIEEENIQKDFEETKKEDENEPIEQVQEKEKFNIEKFTFALKKNMDFTFSDEKIFKEIFSSLYYAFEYDLAVINLYSFENEENKVFFDIKDIILSPIFKDSILNKFGAKTNIMYKKYAPNLPVVVQENEFLSKIEFNFEYKDENIGNFIFYSKEKLKWENNLYLEEIKNLINEFMKNRYIARTSENSKKDSLKNKYFSFSHLENIKNEQNVYFGIIQITNFSELASNMSQEDLDIINSKISEKIVNYLEEGEKVFKNFEDEYDIVICADDEGQLLNKLEFISKEIDMISYNENNIETLILATSCKIDGNFNIVEAQKKAREFIESHVEQQEKVVII